MPVRKTGAAPISSAKLGGLGWNSDGRKAAYLLHGKGGAIAFDSSSTKLGGVDHEVSRSARHADGSARTWQQSWRDRIKKLVTSNDRLRTAAPRARQLDSADNPMLLGRENKNPRDLTRLQALRANPGNNGDGAPGGGGGPQAVMNAQQRTLAAQGQLGQLNDAIANQTDNLLQTLRTSHDAATRTQRSFDAKGFFARKFDFSSKDSIDQQRLVRQGAADRLDQLGNDALNRLSNLETTLKGASDNGQVGNEDARRIATNRRNVLGKMIEARLPGLRIDPNAQPAVPQSLGGLLNDINPAFDALRQKELDFQNAGTPSEKLDALRGLEQELDQIHRGDRLDLAQAIRVLAQNEQAPLDGLRSLITAFDDATTPRERADIMQDIRLELVKLQDADHIDANQFGQAEAALDRALNLHYDLGFAKTAIVDEIRKAAIHDTIEQLIALEQAHGQDKDYQALRGALINNLVRFGHTRDWANSADGRDQRKAAESLNALAHALRDRANVDMVLGADKRFDALAARLKITAATREINEDNDDNKAQRIERATALIEAEHDLRTAQRALAAGLEVSDFDGAKKADPDVLNLGNEANRGRGRVRNRDGQFVDQDAHGDALSHRAARKGRLFTGKSMGDVRMDARFLKAVRNTRGGDENARHVNLLMAEVRHKQDRVDALKKEADPKAPLTQAEAGLMRHVRTRLPKVTQALNDARQAKLDLETQRDDDQRPALNEDQTARLNALPDEIAALADEQRALQEQADAGPEAGEGPHARSTLGNYARQVAAERDAQRTARHDQGAFSDHGIDRTSAKKVFGDKGGLVRAGSDNALIDETERSLRRDGAAPDQAQALDEEQETLVKKSIGSLVGLGMHSTDEALEANKNISRLATKMFSKTSNIMAEQMEISSDFSPEVQANAFTRSVLQTYADDNGALAPSDNAVRTRVSRLGAELRTDKIDHDATAGQIHDRQRQQDNLRLHIDQRQIALNGKRRELEKLRKPSKDANLDHADNDEDGSNEVQIRMDTLEREIRVLNEEIAERRDRITGLGQQIDNLQTTNEGRFAHFAAKARDDEFGIVRESRGVDVDADQIADFEDGYAAALGDRQRLIDARPEPNDDDAPQRMNHKDLLNVLRAAVLSARPKGVRLDAYNPVDHKQAIEATLDAWGLDPALVRPELDDIMSTSLDKTELERWQREFAPDDRSKGAGDKRYTGSVGAALKRPFTGAIRSDHSKDRTRARLDQQLRHMNAQIDELVPGSKIRITKSAGRAVDAAAQVKVVPFAEVGGGVSVQGGKEDELEIGCGEHEYELEIKPGWARGYGAELTAEFGSTWKMLKLGATASVGFDLERTRFAGVVLKFKHDGTAQDRELAKQKMQTLIERMASGEEMRIDEWNALCSETGVLLENVDQSSVKGSGGASAGVTANLLDSGVDLEAAFAATGTKTNRTKTQTVVNSETTTVKDERLYTYQTALSGSASGKIALGAPVDDPTLGSDKSSRKPDLNMVSRVDDELGLAGKEFDVKGGKVGLDANIQLSGGKGYGTTWSREAFARSQITTDTASGLIEDAEMSFLSTMSGHVLNTDEERQEAGRELLAGIARWSGHEQAVQDRLDANHGALGEAVDKVLKQTSGSDFLALKLKLKPSRIRQANELLSQANHLEDPGRGAVTQAKQDQARLLREQAQAIVHDRANYMPVSVNLMPAQTDQVTRKSPWIPLVTDFEEEGDGAAGRTQGSARKMAALFIDPAIEFSNTLPIGKGSPLPVTGDIKGTMIEQSRYMQFFANSQSLDTEEQMGLSPFSTMGDEPVVPADDQ